MQTNDHTAKKNRVIKALLFSFISFVMLTILYHIILYHDMSADKERYGYIAKNQAEHIITTIDCVMSRTNTLTTMVKDHKAKRMNLDIQKTGYNSYRSISKSRMRNL